MKEMPAPNAEYSSNNMWDLMAELFPVYRALCGPGFLKSLEIIQKHLSLDIKKFPSGQKVFDWTIPKEFDVNKAYVEGPDGKRYLDFDDCNYHVWLYSKSFKGEMDREELIKNIATMPEYPDSVPLRNAYYRDLWGLSGSVHQIQNLPEGRYKVNIDTEHYDGFLRIGEYYLPGETKDEIMITSYLCHPMGANDNLSGVVLSVELFKLLAQLSKRRYSYRLLIWPETIGSVTYIANFPDRIKNVVGGYVVTCVGDGGDFTYKRSFNGDSLIDRAAIHALKHSEHTFKDVSYRHDSGSDECRFNSVGLRLPFGSIMRTMYGHFPQYHSSEDNLSFVQKKCLYESLKIYWSTLMTLERAVTYKGKFIVDPFLTKHGIHPWDQGTTGGNLGSAVGSAYYHLMGGVDGKSDLLEIADKAGEPITVFDRAVEDFLRTGLMEKVN